MVIRRTNRTGLAIGVALASAAAWMGCDSNNDPEIGTVIPTGSGGAATTIAASSGSGATVCPGGTACGDVCTNTQFDPANCGVCGLSCPSGEVCSAGSCVATCESGGTKQCGEVCVDIKADTKNCGGCGKSCEATEVCVEGACQLECSGGTTKCEAGCFNLKNTPAHCGSCEVSCDAPAGQVCSQGLCAFSCLGATTNCGGLCVDIKTDATNCGGCGKACKAGEVCDGSACASECGIDRKKCGSSCLDVMNDRDHCGDCDTACKSNELCKSGFCKVCDPKTTDCDGDGWKEGDGDCCDLAGACGANPALVNPGAVEVLGNGLDDNCNGKQDLFDLPDTASCDASLSSNSSTSGDYAKALGICRTTTTAPALKDKTWGLIEAKLVRADGSPLTDTRARSLRNTYGSLQPATLEGQKAVVLSTGIAADKVQLNPGPNVNGGLASTEHTPTSTADLATCSDPLCIKDWFVTNNPPLKKANELPVAPMCGDGSTGEPKLARDSVMLALKLRAPTNARAFQLSSYFLSSEFPDFVCSDYNDQFAVLVDTPKPTSPVPNPVDKNLMVFADANGTWPVGINVAKGTSLFTVCDFACATDVAKGGNKEVSLSSCSLGASQLVNTGFGVNTGSCPAGGGTFWLTTSGNVVPGQLLTLRIVIWDVGDHSFDSTAVLDGFKWLLDATVPGTAEN